MVKALTLIQALTLTLAITINAIGQTPNGRSPVVLEIANPAGPGSAEPNLFRDARDQLFLSWIEKMGEKRHALRFSVRDEKGWSEPRTIAEGDNWFVNWADFPSLIALPDSTLAAHWLVKSGPGTYSYDVNISISTDGGKTWSKPKVPHRDGTQTEHGFVSLIAWPGNRLGAVWLDGRKMTSKEHGHDGHGSLKDEMSLRHTTIAANGQLSDDVLLDPRVCECCQTSAVVTAEGAVVVYRDRSEREVRDISFVRFHKGRWTEPQVLHADGWEIPGCPVNGPSIAADKRRVAVAWFTAAKDTPRVNVVFSSDAGATFGQPIQVDDGSPLGRVEVLLLSDGAALVVWLERTGEIRARRIRADGVRGQAITVAESSAARASGFPQMARVGDEIFFAWTQPGSPSRVRTARVKLP